MPKLKQLSGKEVITILERFGFKGHIQRGSHVKLRRISSLGTKETLTIPLHEEIDTGTLRAIYRQSLKFISETELRGYFCNE